MILNLPRDYKKQEACFSSNRQTITHTSAYADNVLTYNDEVGCFEGVGETVVEQYQDIVVDEVGEVGEAAEDCEQAPR